jgi:hypothetical protein
MAKKFSKWVRWSERNSLENIHCPGIYAIARSSRNIAGEPFTMRKEIVYFGMTNARSGLKSRMQQFENTINGKRGHGGAQRVLFKHADYHNLVARLYVAVSYTQCAVTSNLPEDLRLMGEVARQEYRCLADYVEQFDRLPEFNDKDRSPKKARAQEAL